MKKSIIYSGLGIVVAALLVFLLRLINVRFFQDNMKLLFLLGGASLVLILLGAIMKKMKSLLWFGVGGLIASVAEFLIRMTGFQDNVTLFVVVLIVGLAVLILGVVKTGR